jgi:hypothetical protein
MPTRLRSTRGRQDRLLKSSTQRAVGLVRGWDDHLRRRMITFGRSGPVKGPKMITKLQDDQGPLARVHPCGW